MVKVLYLKTKLQDQELVVDALKGLPKDLFIAYSIQYEVLAKQIRTALKAKKHNIKGFRQVLGCSKLKVDSPILLVSSGKFHALNLALQNSCPIYIYDHGQIKHVDEQYLKRLNMQKKAAISKFLANDTVGILVSTKYGQENLKSAKALKVKLAKNNKKAYLFLSNKINVGELENFKIPIWVNTACPGMAYDSNKIVNIDDINQFL